MQQGVETLLDNITVNARCWWQAAGWGGVPAWVRWLLARALGVARGGVLHRLSGAGALAATCDCRQPAAAAVPNQSTLLPALCSWGTTTALAFGFAITGDRCIHCPAWVGGSGGITAALPCCPGSTQKASAAFLLPCVGGRYLPHPVTVPLPHTRAVLAYATSHLSGGQMNPAVSLGLALSGTLGPLQAAANMLAQLVGAILGSSFLYATVPHAAASTLGSNAIARGVSTGNAFVGEAVRALRCAGGVRDWWGACSPPLMWRAASLAPAAIPR